MASFSSKIKVISKYWRIPILLRTAKSDQGETTWFPEGSATAEQSLMTIRYVDYLLKEIGNGDLKPSKQRAEQILTALQDALENIKIQTRNYGAGPLNIPGGLAVQSISPDFDLTFDSFKRYVPYINGHAGEVQTVVDSIRDAIEGSPISFLINERYPFIRRTHVKSVNGNSLLNDDEYSAVSGLRGDKLKTAILEIMAENLQVANADNFHQIKSRIEGSAAYRILQASQSLFGTRVFFKGKTRSEEVIELLIDGKARELGVSLEPQVNGLAEIQ